MNTEEIRNLTAHILIKEIEFLIKNLPTKRILVKNGFKMNSNKQLREN